LHWISALLRNVEVLTAVAMKRAVIWYVTLCQLVDVHQNFGRTNCLHLQGQRVSHSSNQQAYCLFPSVYLLGIPFDPEDGGSLFFQNDVELWLEPHSITSQMMIVFNILDAYLFRVQMKKFWI
jgi:hypothetical protein